MAALKKAHNSPGYSSPFSKQPSQKSSRPKTSILKNLGYIKFYLAGSVESASNEGLTIDGHELTRTAFQLPAELVVASDVEK
jgi:hypothetical protein